MMRHRIDGRSTIRRAFMVIALSATILLIGLAAAAQESDITFVPPPETSADTLAQDMESAEALFNDGLATMNEATLRRAAADFERIVDQYSHDSRHFDAYFASAYIHMEYLQGVSDYQHAANLLNLLITNHPSNYPQVADAHMMLAHLYYRCLRDYGTAAEHLRAVLNNTFLSNELGAKDVEAKAMLAKCCQKLGRYNEARSLWEEVVLSNPELDTEGRLEWIRNSEDWFMVDDGTVRLFFESDIERVDYTRCLSGVRDGLSMAESTWGLMPAGTVDVFLYSSMDHLFDYTLRSDGFALPVDAEIYLALDDLDDIGHLTGWLVAQRLNTRPDATVFPLLRAGFNHYFLGSRDEIDRLAAREIYYYGGRIEDVGLLFPMSFDYTFSDEFAAMSSSFLHYLIDEGRVSTDGLEEFYRLLRDNPRGRWHAPLMSMLARYNFEDGDVASWQDTLLTPEQVQDLFANVLDIDVAQEIEAWHGTLADEIAAVEAELGALTVNVQRVDVDLSTAEKALESWWNAYRAGDFDSLIQASTRDMASFFEEARQIYQEQGVFEQVLLDSFIIPYRGARMVVVQTGTFAEDLYVFEVQIEKSDGVEEWTFVVRREGNLWKVDSN